MLPFPTMRAIRPDPSRCMRLLRRSALACGLALCALGSMAQNADKTAEKAARRMQLQMQNLQQQLQDGQAAKAKGDADKVAVDKELLASSQEVVALKGSLRKANDKIKAQELARTQLATSLAASLAAGEKLLAEQLRSADTVLATKGRELAQYTQSRDEQQAALQRRHDERVGQVTECTAKNERLVKLSAELLDRYRNKTVSDVLKQREPVLGLGEVETFNLVQEYRDKADAERYTPLTNR